MAQIFYVHWNRAESDAQTAALQTAGHTVICHATARKPPKLSRPPDVFVISLARLPSHGRAVAKWCQGSQQRRAIPLAFVGGSADQVAATRKQFPDAICCTPQELPSYLPSVPKPPS